MGNVEKAAFNIDEVAQDCGFGRTFIYAEIKAGRLRAKKAGSRTKILRLDRDEWLARLPAFQSGDAHD